MLFFIVKDENFKLHGSSLFVSPSEDSWSYWGSLWGICISSSCSNIHKILVGDNFLQHLQYCEYPTFLPGFLKLHIFYT